MDARPAKLGTPTAHLISANEVARIEAVVQDAMASGATVLARGGPATDGALADGAFYRPTLLEVGEPGLPVVQDEIFGPVLTMMIFGDEPEAARRGYKGSGQGRMRGLAVVDDSVEYKHVAFAPGAGGPQLVNIRAVRGHGPNSLPAREEPT